MNIEEAMNAQAAVDAEFAARIAHDYDPEGFVHSCIHHDGTVHEGHIFLTYCVVCPEDTGNGRESDAARMAREARTAQDLAQRFGGDVPF